MKSLPELVCLGIGLVSVVLLSLEAFASVLSELGSKICLLLPSVEPPRGGAQTDSSGLLSKARLAKTRAGLIGPIKDFFKRDGVNERPQNVPIM